MMRMKLIQNLLSLAVGDDVVDHDDGEDDNGDDNDHDGDEGDQDCVNCGRVFKCLNI